MGCRKKFAPFANLLRGILAPSFLISPSMARPSMASPYLISPSLVSTFLILMVVVCPARSEVEADLDGATIFQKFCSRCHSIGASSEPQWYPSLSRIVSSLETQDAAAELVAAIDRGQFRRSGEVEIGEGAGHPIPVMPSWSWLDDAEMASLVHYLTSEFSSKAAAILPAEVRAVREKNSETNAYREPDP